MCKSQDEMGRKLITTGVICPFVRGEMAHVIGQISPISFRDLQIMSAEFPKTVCDNLHVERILNLPPVVLLKIEGKCAGFRAKCAHISGHLPLT
jgi:hypothetical protein